MPGAVKKSTCQHVTVVQGISWRDIHTKKLQLTCDTCVAKGPNLWLCLEGQCMYVGCGESAQDHSSKHSQGKRHRLTINLTTLRIWCYVCESEVHANANTPHFEIKDQIEDTESSDEDEEKPRGLTGLQNIGNTCYMNAALQALSNCPPLRGYFMECSECIHTDKKPMLSRSYMKLMMDMWHKRRPSYITPSTVSSGIKMVHPMFRGYSQQDTQEFLRCFMDQIHEELKQPIREEEEVETDQSEASCHDNMIHKNQPDRQPSIDSTLSGQSDTEYETCDSGLSSERSSTMEQSMSSDDGTEMTEQLNNDNYFNTAKRKVPIGASSSSLTSGDSLGPIDAHSQSDIYIHTPKDYKDRKNRNAKNLAIGDINETKRPLIGHSINDSGDFSDTAANLESPSHRVNVPTRSRSRRSSENERPQPIPHPSPVTLSGPKKRAPVQYRSIISDIFDGKILSSVQCLTCERVSSTKETFQDLSLPIPSKDQLHMIYTQAATHGSMPKVGSCGEVNLNQGWMSWMFGWLSSWFMGPTITLQDCLAAFFSADELKGDNMYSCEKCKKLRNGMKYSKVLELPEILCIHMKRFRHEFMYSSKINSYVSFPLEGLDMGPYLHRDCTSEVQKYDLVGVIVHHGTAGGGHYTAYALNSINGQWYEFDDQYVTEVDAHTVETCEAYVLFYRKTNVEMMSLRNKVEEMVASQETSLMQFYISKQWMNRFKMFAEPGPISNSDFLCQHGGIPPHIRMDNVEGLTIKVSQEVWEFLHERFGGGPSVNRVFQCTTCLDIKEKLENRQKHEMETFVKLNKEFQEEDDNDAIYVISMVWFREWENFVRGKHDDAPGPIDNTRIQVMKSGVPTIRQGSDYGQLSREMWDFLFGIYGGGPLLPLKQKKSPIQGNQESRQGSQDGRQANQDGRQGNQDGSNINRDSQQSQNASICTDTVSERTSERV
ncbi:unnamed protein product [Owenia fusiformis]|uniref:Ubiquitin carboxyl-terminal hydrolase n=1 Tax=Owenia fusiformis TaxID=6347 RepID=A0A8J1U3H9_OWEFU|nr:unnamed protein product [Owenia fusiformis]